MELTSCAGVRLTPAVLKSTVRRLGWSSRRRSVNAYSDALWYVYREFPDAGLSVALSCAEGAGAVEFDAAWFYRTESRAGKPVRLDSIPPRVYSEAVRDLALLARGLEPEPDEKIDEINDAIPEEVSDAAP